MLFAKSLSAEVLSDGDELDSQQNIPINKARKPSHKQVQFGVSGLAVAFFWMGCLFVDAAQLVFESVEPIGLDELH